MEEALDLSFDRLLMMVMMMMMILCTDMHTDGLAFALKNGPTKRTTTRRFLLIPKKNKSDSRQRRNINSLLGTRIH